MSDLTPFLLITLAVICGIILVLIAIVFFMEMTDPFNRLISNDDPAYRLSKKFGAKNLIGMLEMRQMFAEYDAKREKAKSASHEKREAV